MDQSNEISDTKKKKAYDTQKQEGEYLKEKGKEKKRVDRISEV